MSLATRILSAWHLVSEPANTGRKSPTQYFGRRSASQRPTSGKHWDWSDFSRAIEWLCLTYAATMPLPLPGDHSLEGGAKPSKAEMAIFMAERECQLNKHFIVYGGRSDLFNILTRNGQSCLHKVIRTLVGFPTMEVDTGYSCQPCIVYGLADVAYPQILPIVRQRIVEDARAEQNFAI